MGVLDERLEPGTPPPSWSPARPDFWKKPSKWQICMPRLTILAKVLATFLGFILLVKIIGQKPELPSSAPPIGPKPELPAVTPPEPPKPLSENDMKDAAEKVPWIWKDFAT